MRMTTSGATFGLNRSCASGARTGPTSGSVQRRSMMTGRLKGLKSALFRISRATISAMTTRINDAIAYQKNKLRAANISMMFRERAKGGFALRLLPGALFALAEQGRADAHKRRALLDCYLEVVCHTHRKLADAFAEHTARAKFVAKTAQASEVRADEFRVLEERREQHQPSAAHATATFERLDERRQFVRVSAALCMLAREVDLQEHVQLTPSLFGAHAFESCDERRRINRVK